MGCSTCCQRRIGDKHYGISAWRDRDRVPCGVHCFNHARGAGTVAGAAAAEGRLEFGHVSVNAADIIWIEAQDYYVRIHTAGSRHLVRVALSSLEERLDPGTFVRVHRNALVNRREIRQTADDGTLRLVLSNGSTVPVSRARRKAVEAKLLGGSE